ncbi:hypothetical protein BU25DRAFT_424148 [Macroventuria anomochaeta]|uniref:Uncharacterized protein n=1 Tax=Macroventuria anomochaeta TaxID=301207 RepID=A0ACB6RRF3_9PLEO|nr:uncharacterized protein BU25DRAFT_424148 [Macroventuria anomochaeta]KAF2624364.1 hypothetical protein BU25DRAFT_424148 [Macroventuria anomochaeta]
MVAHSVIIRVNVTQYGIDGSVKLGTLRYLRLRALPKYLMMQGACIHINAEQPPPPSQPSLQANNLGCEGKHRSLMRMSGTESTEALLGSSVTQFEQPSSGCPAPGGIRHPSKGTIPVAPWNAQKHRHAVVILPNSLLIMGHEVSWQDTANNCPTYRVMVLVQWNLATSFPYQNRFVAFVSACWENHKS